MRPLMLTLSVALATAAATLSALGQTPTAAILEHECDRLAQPPRQTLGRLPALAEGVGYTALRAPAARAACARAMAEAPDEARFVAYAGRAASKGGDAPEAARLYRLAAERGNALAQNNLGAMYATGEGRLPRDLREAERLYRKAADQGFPSGQANLGAFYATGQAGLARDDREAVRLWQQAAEQEDAQAQNNLAKMYAEGRGGLRRDLREAGRLWRLAAEQGNAEARGNLRKAGIRD